MSDKPSIGIFVCECGAKITGSLDVSALVGQVANLPHVTWAEQTGYWCLPAGVERLRSRIAEQHLDRVVIAGCTPRTHDQLFRRALDGVVNPSLVSVNNLRDLCARPHRGDPLAMAKAHNQIAMAVAELAARQPVTPRVAHITARAVVIGGGIAGMTAALALSDAGIPVTLVERDSELGGGAIEIAATTSQSRPSSAERIAAIRARGNVEVLTSTELTNVSGTIGQYQVALSNAKTIEVGVIIVATGAQRTDSCIPHHVSRDASHYAFILCDMSPSKAQTCSHTCCLDAIRQAAEIKRQVPASKATVFFRELYTAGGKYANLIWDAQQLGVKFVRYPAGRVPQSADGEIVTHDELTGQDVHVPCEQVIVATPMKPQEDAARLATLLRLPIDSNGFIADTRVRLRPAERIERGIYVCGAAHFPCDAERAIFQAYDVAARAVRHIQRGKIINWSPAAAVDATRCNGCGDCVRVCPFAAISLTERHGDREIGRQGDWGRLACVDSLLCTGCGNCVSVCPVRAAQIASARDEQLDAQIQEALGVRQGDGHLVIVSPCHPVLLFACEWSGYSAAEIAGAQQLNYPANTRIIRVNCTGRFQPGLLLKALEMGAAGVMVLGCAPGVCHYEQGNERAATVFEQANALGCLMGMDKQLALKWIPPDDGVEFVRTVMDFVKEIECK